MTATAPAGPIDGTRRTVSGLERASLKPAGIVLAIILGLVFGWIVLDAVIPTPGTEVAAGDTVTLANQARFVPASGWTIEDDKSNFYRISNSGVYFAIQTGPTQIDAVDVLNNAQNALRQSIPDAVYSSPSTFTTSRGLTGVQSTLTSAQLTGRLVVVVSSGVYVFANALGPPVSMNALGGDIDAMFESIEILR
ncbi:MAG TPA: hypothetical protein VEP49_22530 [Acidimicrobiia bacterium]|nr:hypothetical protein [Acidimicrobiia bacterium]